MAWQQLNMSILDIPMQEIYSAMGTHGQEPDSATVHTTEYLLKEAAQFLRPQFKYLLLDGSVDCNTGVLTICSPNGPEQREITLYSGGIIARQLRGAERFALFVATVGKGYLQWEEAVKRRDDIHQSYVMDCVGSQIVESVADYMESVLQAEIAPLGFKRTNRFSPGYCGWHVSEQQLLFTLFEEAHPCGIELTESSIMLPMKSVSGIIGIGTNVRYLPYSCGICNKKDCYKRK